MSDNAGHPTDPSTYRRRDTRLRAQALGGGAKDFISKPLDALETMLRVWNLLETRALYNKSRTLVPTHQIELLR